MTWNWVQRVEQDFEAIVADLSGIVKRLEARAEKRIADAAEHAAEAARHGGLGSAAREEADKAKSAAAKIGALLS